jgi:probable HAF family extracellular repeat protein
MFSAEASKDADGDSLMFTWLPGDGRVFDGPQPARQGWAYDDDGAFVVSVIVTDSKGARDTAQTALTVVNVPPMVTVTSAPSQQAVNIPAQFRFTVMDSGYRDMHTMKVEWGDGTSDSTALDSMQISDSLMHTFHRTGSYQLKVIARDDDGGVTTIQAAHPVLVIDPNARKTVAGYESLDLGTLGGNSARPLDFNDYGKIVGSSLTASGQTHAFLWDNGAMGDLGTMGKEGSEAQRINNAGHIAGVVWSTHNDDCNHDYTAAIWRNGTGTVLDSRAAVGKPVRATGINEAGDITWSACGHEDYYAWLLSDNRWQRVGGLYSPLSASYANSMNEHGQIVGMGDAVYTGESPGAYPHAFLWEVGTTHDLGQLEYRPCPSNPAIDCGYSVAVNINESGQIVGTSTAADGSIHVVMWEGGSVHDLWAAPPQAYPWPVLINDVGQVAWSTGGESIFWSQGKLYALGSLGGGSTSVVDMNEAGAIAGTSKTANGEQHAFVWTRENGMVDLGTGPYGFNTAWVIGISFNGDVAGYTAQCVAPTPGYWCGSPDQVRAVLWRRGP